MPDPIPDPIDHLTAELGRALSAYALGLARCPERRGEALVTALAAAELLAQAEPRPDRLLRTTALHLLARAAQYPDVAVEPGWPRIGDTVWVLASPSTAAAEPQLYDGPALVERWLGLTWRVKPLGHDGYSLEVARHEIVPFDGADQARASLAEIERPDRARADRAAPEAPPC